MSTARRTGYVVTWRLSAAMIDVMSRRTVLISVVGLMACTASNCLLVEPVAAARPTPIRVQVVLDTHEAMAGPPINAIVILINRAPNPITVHACSADQWLQVGLKGNGYTYQPTHTLVACSPTIQLRPGQNRFHASVFTTYQRCVDGGRPTASTPACLGGTMTAPPLPAGKYETSVFISSLTHLTTAATPQAVSLTR